MGYATTTWPAVRLNLHEEAVVELRIAQRAVELDPIVVVTERRPVDPRLDRRGYYERRDRYGRAGAAFGSSLDAADLNEVHAFRASDILKHVNGMRVVPVGGRDLVVTLPRCASRHVLRRWG